VRLLRGDPEAFRQLLQRQAHHGAALANAGAHVAVDILHPVRDWMPESLASVGGVTVLQLDGQHRPTLPSGCPRSKEMLADGHYRLLKN
jgi:hypothetical protein